MELSCQLRFPCKAWAASNRAAAQLPNVAASEAISWFRWPWCTADAAKRICSFLFSRIGWATGGIAQHDYHSKTGLRHRIEFPENTADTSAVGGEQGARDNDCRHDGSCSLTLSSLSQFAPLSA